MSDGYHNLHVELHARPGIVLGPGLGFGWCVVVA